MNDSFADFTENQGAAPQQETSKKSTIAKEKTPVGEYIDFEEIE
ncbi:hypothetical protein OAG27_04110 [Flavobacteriaceae bacterium]|nr:hypothetical protein [Flavobacteriaceae bacterium]